MIDIELNRNASLFHVPNGNPPPLPSLDRGLRHGSFIVPQVESSGSQTSVGPSEYREHAIFLTPHKLLIFTVAHEQILKDLLPRAPMTSKGSWSDGIRLHANYHSDVKPRSNARMPYKLVPSPAHLLALIPGKRKAIEVC